MVTYSLIIYLLRQAGIGVCIITNEKHDNYDNMSTQRVKMTASMIYMFSTHKVNYFRLFNLPHHFTEEQLKTSYLQLVKIYHPDLTNHPDAPSVFRNIQEGY